MKVRKRNYPIPVLAEFSDDIRGNFTANYDVLSFPEKYKIYVEITCSNEELLSMISEKKCEYVVNVECTYTRYRKIFKSYNDKITIDIDAEDIEGKVEVVTFITATKDFSEYKNPDFHDDYEDISFRVIQGQILAIDSGIVFDAENEEDKLTKLQSIFSVQLDSDIEAAPYNVDTSNDRVIIKLNRINYEKYTYLRECEELQPILFSQMLLPAIVQILNDIVGESENEIDELSQYRWYRVIKNKLSNLDREIEELEISDILVVSQELIGDPITNALGCMMESGED